MNERQSDRQAGFSLVELLVAMTVTLIVSGAVYGLLAGGGDAFKREPERSDLQQNLRMAMDVIMRDISNAGAGMGPWSQTFTRGLDDLANASPAVPLPQAGQLGTWDQLRFLADDGTCPKVYAEQNGANLQVKTGAIPDCYPEPALVLVYYANGTTLWGWGHNIHATDQKINFPNGQQPDESQLGIPGTLGGANGMGRLQLIRYELAYAPGDTIPSLWRSEQAGFDYDNDAEQTHPSDGQAAIDAGRWEMIARGIEDLQIQYRSVTLAGADEWTDEPDVVVAEDVATVSREVRITLGGRGEGRDSTGRGRAVQGQRDSLAGTGAAIRSQLVSSAVPRAALLAYQARAAGAPTFPGGATTPVWR